MRPSRQMLCFASCFVPVISRIGTILTVFAVKLDMIQIRGMESTLGHLGLIVLAHVLQCALADPTHGDNVMTR